jgi:hypothetical protein
MPHPACILPGEYSGTSILPAANAALLPKGLGKIHARGIEIRVFVFLSNVYG